MKTKYAPIILSVVAIVGVIATAGLSADAALKVERLDAPVAKNPTEYVKTNWKLYIPAMATGVLTVACIISVNHIWAKRVTSIVAAAGLAERVYEEYREKVIDQFGETADRTVREAVSQDAVDAAPVKTSEIVMLGTGGVLFMDALSSRYFESDIESMRKIENDLNWDLVNNMSGICLNDLYASIGLPPTALGEELGWNSDRLVEFEYNAAVSTDGRPCIVLEQRNMPVTNYYKIG